MRYKCIITKVRLVSRSCAEAFSRLICANVFFRSSQIVEKKREDLYEILEDIVRVFCVKQEWILGEVWAPEMTDEKVVLKRVKCVKNPCCDRDETLFIEE
uniref:Uncharacterized protein n=1 Tax=Rhodosorus marinus TaxID=101924 RepID=A0A7S3EL64_9RHOD|mmetsp:Transcript_41664/g.163602  ORF Transcript_41664/g.163602 Transcript_41664/m.163602 type:complete len:100 (+) Transcript_41664:469-768(+)